MFTGDQSIAIQTAHESVSRLIGDVKKFDRAMKVKARPCEDNLLFTLHGWVTLARIVSKLGIKLWEEIPIKRNTHEESQSGNKVNEFAYQPWLCRAPEYAVVLSLHQESSCNAKNQIPSSLEQEGNNRWLPVHWTAQQWDCPSPWRVSEDDLSHYDVEPMQFGERKGHEFAPFWNLGLS